MALVYQRLEVVGRKGRFQIFYSECPEKQYLNIFNALKGGRKSKEKIRKRAYLSPRKDR